MRNQDTSGEKTFTSPIVFTPPRNSVIVRKIFVDFFTIIVLCIPILVLFVVGQPFKRGFNCDDESIRYPFHENTISSPALYLYSTLIPLFVICSNEYLLLQKYISFDSQSGSSDYFWKVYFWQMYLNVVPLMFAAASSQLITDIAKYSIGRLRPHFIDLCRPAMPDGQILYRNSPCQAYGHTYITDFHCTNDVYDPIKMFRDARLSFMSGHSSFSAVCLGYLIIYIQHRIRWTSLILLRSLFQMSLVSLILFSGFSRISDYKHHWSDVLIGLVQGTTVAILSALYVSDMHRVRSYSSSSRINSASPSSSQLNRESGV